MPLGAWQRGSDLSKIGVLLISVRCRKLRGVEDIRSFGPELEPPAFREREVFENGEIERPVRWTDISLEPDITLSDLGTDWGKHGGVEPLIRRAPSRRLLVGTLAGQ